MARGSYAACGFCLAVIACAFLGPAFVPGKTALRGAVAPSSHHLASGVRAESGGYPRSTAVAALALAGLGLQAVGLSRRRAQRSSSVVATRALGSINQFKVFGPPEDPFEIQVDKILGVGGQGTVYLCHRQSNPGKVYAVKTIPIWRLLMDPSSEEKIAAIEKEVDVLLRIQGHPNVCECIGCYDAFRPGTSQAQYKMMVMELIDGGELASYIKDKGATLTEDVAKSVLKQTALGLQFIHSKNVLHRDLKCENILVCDKALTATSKVKLIDFGVAKYVANSFGRSCVGTTEIMAPELVSAKMMILPKGATAKTHGPITFKPPTQMSPGFGIISQRPNGKGAMVNGIEPGGQAQAAGVGDGWAITKINGVDITNMPFIKDFNEIGAGTKAGVTAIAEILGNLTADFTMDFMELPKREFSKSVDIWSLGVVLYTMLAGVTPFKDEENIVNGEYDESRLANCSQPAKDLVKGLLQLDPTQRLTLEQVLAHPWLAGVP
mmetsp:Transcript_14680/g.32236  ORF Transcript_14680/g.32236 Transcript_14680/m.32236 type:complete len:494 (-) Transcript_14680:124-1605(-)